MDEEPISTALLQEEIEDGNGEISQLDGVDCSSITFMLAYSTFVIVCGAYTMGNAMGYSSPAESGIINDIGLSSAAYSLFGSILTIGGLTGALLCGKIADFVGRRGAICVSNALCIIGWLAIAFSKNAWSLDLGRLLTGVGVSILTYVTHIYVAEITPKSLRGALEALITLVMGFGISCTFVIGSVFDWRNLALLGTIPCLLQLLGVIFIPESPRWLAKFGHQKELEVALYSLRGKNADISLEFTEIIDYTKKFDQMAKDGIADLFQLKYAYAIIVGAGLMTLRQFVGLEGYTYYLSSILVSAGFPSGIGSGATGIVHIGMNICSLFLIDKYGRRPLLLVSSSGSCLGSLITGFSFLLQGFNLGKEITPSLAFVGILVFVGSAAFGLAGIPWIIVAEIYPVNIKGSAGSLMNLISWSGSWIITYTFSYLFEWSSAGLFFIYSVIAGFGVIFVAKLVPETKGRTLEQIQASLLASN